MLTPQWPSAFSRDEFEDASFGERVEMSAREWVRRGFGAPFLVYLLYAANVALLFLVWSWTCPEADEGSSAYAWMFTGEAWRKLVFLSLLYEIVGLGCGQGPLSGKYNKPFLAPLWQWLRVGTIRLPAFGGRVPFTSGTRRSWFDVALYATLLGLLVRAVLSDRAGGYYHAVPVVAVVVLCGLRDKTMWAAARSEHYVYTLVCMAFPGDTVAASKAVLLAVWFFAGIAKLSPHFSYVVMTMACNTPWYPRFFKRWFVGEGFRPTAFAKFVTYLGTIFELAVPVYLSFTGHRYAVWAMMAFHAHIVLQAPIAVPIAWNFVVVHSMWFFYASSDRITAISFLDVSDPVLIAFLLVVLVCVPVLGMLRPDLVSFLAAYRYYAGLWPFNVWLFRPGCQDEALEKCNAAAPSIREQLDSWYNDPLLSDALLFKPPAFRMLHLQGRALQTIMPVACAGDIESYEIAMDGDIMGGLLLGYNFGDGHLNGAQLLAAVQERCNFKYGQLTLISCEGVAVFEHKLDWKIYDAARGLRKQGSISTTELLKRSVWPQKPLHAPQSSPLAHALRYRE